MGAISGYQLFDMFGKKFNSKRLLVSSKVWMQAALVEKNDVVIVLADSNNSDLIVMWLLARFQSRSPNLSVHFHHHCNSGLNILYVTTSYDSLLQWAEKLAIRKLLKKEFGDGMAEFVYADLVDFECVEEKEIFFTSQERHSIILHMMNDLRAVEGEKLNGVCFLESQPILPRMLSEHMILGVFPLHNQPDIMDLHKEWVLGFFKHQPLDDISNYFGVKIGLYFAYLGHYTKWLVLPAVVGSLVWLLQGTVEWFEDMAWVAFSIFNVLWATLFIIHWKRTSASLTYRWGTMDKKDDLLKDPRPLYKGDLRKSPVTGKLGAFYPEWRRNMFRYCVSAPVILLCLLFVLIVMLLIFRLEDLVAVCIVSGNIPGYFLLGPKVLLAVVIAYLNDAYKQVAVLLNDKENHRLEETHENNLVCKLVLFQFVNSFLALFYIAFYLRDMDRLRDTLATLLITKQIVGNIKEVLLPFLRWKGRLFTVGYKMAGRMSVCTLDDEVQKVSQVYRRRLRASDSTAPPSSSPSDCGLFITPNSSTSRMSHVSPDQDTDAADVVDEEVFLLDEASRSSDMAHHIGQKESIDGMLTQAEVESVMIGYDNAFEDYLEMVIQFGYVTLFSSAFPLAAACAFMNNVIEIRSDAFKLCYTLRRPFGVRVESIGIWQDVLQVMVVIAVFVNSALIGTGELSHRMAPGLSDSVSIILIVTAEHVMLLVMCCLEFAIPDVPHNIATKMARVEYLRREALRKVSGNVVDTPSNS